MAKIDVWRGAMRLATLVAAAIAFAGPAASQSDNRFDGWAAVVISADWRDATDHPIAAFDNARNDLVSGLTAAGFSHHDLYEVSLRPDAPHPVTAEAALKAVSDLTARATKGCLIYFTSHGGPEGMVFGPDVTLTPTALATLVRQWCPSRPAVVVVSACFSGIFVDSLAGANRMILTAARRDRSSFGCGADARYPHFDGCVIESLRDAADLIALANAARACVRRREMEEGLSPASEPQVSIGANMQLLLPTLRFNRSTTTPIAMGRSGPPSHPRP